VIKQKRRSPRFTASRRTRGWCASFVEVAADASARFELSIIKFESKTLPRAF